MHARGGGGELGARYPLGASDDDAAGVIIGASPKDGERERGDVGDGDDGEALVGGEEAGDDP